MKDPIEGRILALLRQCDGLCLDDERERERLAKILAEALSDIQLTPAEAGTNQGLTRPDTHRGGTRR